MDACYISYSTLILFTPASTDLRGLDSERQIACRALIENDRMVIKNAASG